MFCNHPLNYTLEHIEMSTFFADLFSGVKQRNEHGYANGETTENTSCAEYQVTWGQV